MKKLLLPFFFIGTIAMMIVMAKTGAPLKTPSTPKGILDLEFAYNTEKVNTVIKAWDWQPGRSIDNNGIARINTYFDFIFLFFYSGFLFLACRRIAQNMKGPVVRAGNIIAFAAMIAGFLDILENAGMLLSLNGHISATIAFLTCFFSMIKWVLALIAVLYVLTGFLILAWRRITTRPSRNGLSL